MEDFTSMLNASSDGWIQANGVVFTRVTQDEVVAEMTILPSHLQAFGIVHGGVHCALVETVASVGAAVTAIPRGQMVVGLENHTTFLKAVRSGKLTVRCTPVTRGRRTQVWEAGISDDAGRRVAQGSVRLLCLDKDETVAGEGMALKPRG
jgi:uncharacterized protein (TIGR00369 family)